MTKADYGTPPWWFWAIVAISFAGFVGKCQMTLRAENQYLEKVWQCMQRENDHLPPEWDEDRIRLHCTTIVNYDS